MTNFNPLSWLVVALVIVGLAFVVPAVSAHGNETTADHAPPYDGISDDWATWMENRMIAHMGPGSVEWMEDHMDLTVDEMAGDMADDGQMAGHGPGGYGCH